MPRPPPPMLTGNLRVRSARPFHRRVIKRAARAVKDFKQLLTAIQRSNGIVYVEPGTAATAFEPV